jgi:hypothetical protein
MLESLAVADRKIVKNKCEKIHWLTIYVFFFIFDLKNLAFLVSLLLRNVQLISSPYLRRSRHAIVPPGELSL